MSAETWRAQPDPSRRASSSLRTLAGRLVLGPFVVRAASLALRSATAGTRRRPAAWSATSSASSPCSWSCVRRAGCRSWVYVVGVSWGGGALSLLRSFAEHRNVDQGTRSAVVRSGRFFSLLYLNNNLHHTHHAQPGCRGSSCRPPTRRSTAIEPRPPAPASTAGTASRPPVPRRAVRPAGRSRRRADDVAEPRQRLDWRCGADRVNECSARSRPSGRARRHAGQSPARLLAAGRAVPRSRFFGSRSSALAARLDLRRSRL